MVDIPTLPTISITTRVVKLQLISWKYIGYIQKQYTASAKTWNFSSYELKEVNTANVIIHERKVYDNLTDYAVFTQLVFTCEELVYHECMKHIL